jgi:FKBP-type peptidyl-prolyl cis-trans isomerase
MRRPRFLAVWAAGLSLLGVVACDDAGTGSEANPVLPLEEVEFAPELGIDTAVFRAQSGVWVHDDPVGDSLAPAAAAGDVARLYYTGWTSAGVLFDRVSEEDGPPAALRLGAPGPMPGLSAGLTGMRPGGDRTVLVPPALGFGAATLPEVPSNAWLVLRLRLVSLEDAGG